jgi:hypothetical protein
MVTAGLAALIEMTPAASMVMSPSVVVSWALSLLPLTSVAAPAAENRGTASNAAVAAESIKRCFVNSNLIIVFGQAEQTA